MATCHLVCLIAKGNKMKTKFVAPYLIGGMMTLASWVNINSSAGNDIKRDVTDSTKYKLSAYFANADTITIDDLALEEMSPYATEAFTLNKDVVYIMNTGDTIRRKGGTLAWRNNNPGNLAYGEFARENGAIAKGPRSFAVFPDEATGRAALGALLRSNKYNNLTIAKAIVKYAPPAENDVALYHNRLRKLTGLDLNTKICNLDSTQMAKVTDAICVIEGWREGKEHVSKYQGPLMAAAQTQQRIVRDSTIRSK